MTDLRARIAEIVERDRARRNMVAERGGGTEGPRAPRGPRPTEDGETARREGFGAAAEGQTSVPPPSSSVGAAATAPSVGAASRVGPGFDVSERRIDVDDLALEVVGRGAVDPLVVAHLGLRGPTPDRWQDVVFLDTETTGLAGGTGTYVFLVGLAQLIDGELVLRQHLLHDIGAECAFVGHLQHELEPFRACATYNGKSFDIPLLRTRFVMAIRSELTVDDSHLDLLHPARRLWRDRFGSTSLKQLEDSVLDDARTVDIPGSLIPDAYFHYLRKRDPAIIAPVLEHNARDVISLIRIADRVARAVLLARTGRAPDHAPAAFALARIFERTGELDAAFACYESAYYDGDNRLRVRVAIPFARQLERRGEAERVVRMLETLLDLGLGSEKWRAQAESRVRRLTKQLWRRLATAS